MPSPTPPAGRSLHISFQAVPAPGHINPGLGLVSELAARGHRVTYATNAAFAPHVAAAGASPVVYESTPAWADGPGGDAVDLGAAMTAFLGEAKAVLPQLEAAYGEDRPDLIVHDIGAWPAPILAARWDVPYVLLSPTFVAYDGWQEELAPDAPPTAGPVPPDASFPAAMQAWLQAEGFAGGFAELMTPRRALVVLPRSLHPRPDTVGPQNTFVGPLLGDRAFQGTWAAPEGGRPVLLVSFGSAFTDRPDVYRACVEAFADGAWHVVLCIGRHVDPAVLGELPATIEVHRSVPQLDVLSKADAFVSHGGMGGTLEALSHAVPIVAVPEIPEQHVVARQLEALGIGRGLALEQVTAGLLRTSVDGLARDPAVADRLAALQREIHASGGAGAAADIVERAACG
ncbi:MAG: macrolide family glycosyltransferase [Solirubrobacteraceae bacterium]